MRQGWCRQPTPPRPPLFPARLSNTISFLLGAPPVAPCRKATQAARRPSTSSRTWAERTHTKARVGYVLVAEGGGGRRGFPCQEPFHNCRAPQLLPTRTCTGPNQRRAVLEMLINKGHIYMSCHTVSSDAMVQAACLHRSTCASINGDEREIQSKSQQLVPPFGAFQDTKITLPANPPVWVVWFSVPVLPSIH